jgi:hypothetical protein
MAGEMESQGQRVREVTRDCRRLASILVLACLVCSSLCEAHAQDRRSASASLHIHVFVVPTLVAAASLPQVATPAKNTAMSFDIGSQQTKVATHTLRPMISTGQQASKTSSAAVLDTAIFVAD